MSSPNERDSAALSSIASKLSICLLLQIYFSLPLWKSNRPFPEFPVFDLSVTEPLLLGSLIVGLLMIVFLPYRIKIGYWLSLCAMSALILSDLNRLQVWVYLQMSMLFVLGFRHYLSDEVKRIALQWMLAALYFWGGVHKLNIYFVEDIFPWLLEPLIGKQDSPVLSFLAVCAAIFEMMIGLLFLIGSYRKIAFYLSLVFHLGILFLLGPSGHSWNAVIWAWNVAMIAINYYLFYQSPLISWEDRFRKFKQIPIFATALIFFGLLPALNRVNYWPEQLSFKMYSGTQSEAILYFNVNDVDCLERGEIYRMSRTQGKIELDKWAFSELNTPAYTSQRTIKQIGEKYCECFDDMEGAGIELIVAGTWSREDERLLVFPCKELLKD